MPGTITSPKIDALTVEFVKLGYQGASLDFRTQVSDVATFRACMDVIGGYNEFDAGEVSLRLGILLGECMHAVVGRESSVVIYLHLPYWTGQSITAHAPWQGIGESIPEPERAELAARIRHLGRELKADEITSDMHGTKISAIRLWWD